MEKKMIPFKIKAGHPKMSVIYEGKKYVLAKLKKLPENVYKFAIKGNYGIIKEDNNGKRTS